VSAPAEPPIEGYHAHVYYDEKTRAAAAALREAVAARFPVTLGRWRERPVGPHSCAMYQIAFAPGLFAELVPFLMRHHRGLSVFIHPLTGDDAADHSEHALWLGRQLPLDLSKL